MSILTMGPFVPEDMTRCRRVKPPGALFFQDLKIKTIHKGKEYVDYNYLAFLYSVFQ